MCGGEWVLRWVVGLGHTHSVGAVALSRCVCGGGGGVGVEMGGCRDG